MSNKITLYDLPCKGKCVCWSLNPWKARLALNFKKLPYITEWVEYPDIAPKFKSYGILPNPPNVPAQYAIPAVRTTDGKYIMDSLKIAQALEELSPTPSLHLNSDLLAPTQQVVEDMKKVLGPVYIPLIPEVLLNPASAEYFSTTRAQRWGMPLPELAKSNKAGENAWSGARPVMEEMKKILDKDQRGPYVMGDTPSFADFVLAGFWRFVEMFDRDDEIFKRIMKFDESFPNHYDACKEWLKRDD